MGVRIDAHAADVLALGRVLERPLWRILLDVLAEHADTAPDDVLFSVFDPSVRDLYHVMGRRGILRSRIPEGWKPQSIDEEQLRGEPFLRQSMRQYLEGPLSSALTLKSLPRELPTRTGIASSFPPRPAIGGGGCSRRSRPHVVTVCFRRVRRRNLPTISGESRAGVETKACYRITPKHRRTTTCRDSAPRRTTPSSPFLMSPNAVDSES